MKKAKTLLIAFTLFLIIPLSSAKVTVDVQYTPSTILPGDTVEYTLTLKNEGTQDIKVNSITIFSTNIDINPVSISSIGTLPAQSSYKLPFTARAEEPGTYSINVRVYMEDTLKQSYTTNQLIIMNVENKLPDIVLASPLTLGEVNRISFYLTNPVGSISDVTVKALFDAEPKSVYLGDLSTSGSGEFKYIPDGKKDLSFRISFYNGMNYHEFVRTVTPEYRQSKGIIISVSVPHSSVPVLDVVPVEITVSNLRNDTIYSIEISAFIESESDSEKKSKEIPFLGSMENSKVLFQFSPKKSGKNIIHVEVSYEDELNNRYSAEEEIELVVFDEKAISVTNINTEKSIEGITVSGDVSNSGRSTAYNVLLSMQLGDEIKTFYIGSVDSSDFDSFEFDFSNVNESKAILTVTWNNELGDRVELTKEIQISGEVIGEVTEGGNLLLIGAIIVVTVIVLVAVIWIKSGK